jgi:hypothetical protein
MAWNAFIRLRIGSSVGILWKMVTKNYELHKMLRFSWVAEKMLENDSAPRGRLFNLSGDQLVG